MEERPTRVPPTAKHVGDAQGGTTHAEPSVWTDRMLAALHRGVKGGVWFSLIDKVYSPANLTAAATKVVANRGAAGVDHVNVERFAPSRFLKVINPALSESDRPRSSRRIPVAFASRIAFQNKNGIDPRL